MGQVKWIEHNHVMNRERSGEYKHRKKKEYRKHGHSNNVKRLILTIPLIVIIHVEIDNGARNEQQDKTFMYFISNSFYYEL